MQQCRNAILLLVIAASAMRANAAALDPKLGSIGGRVAIAAVPVSLDASGKAITLNRATCEVHLVNTDDETVEQVFACSTWFQPRRGRYLFWIETPNEVSSQTVLNYAGEAFTGSGKLFLKPMHATGRVKLDPAVHIPQRGTFRFLSLWQVPTERAFDRRIASGAANREFRLPAGEAIGGVFDDHGAAIALSRPVRVEASATTVVVPEVPARGRSAVIAVLSRFVAPASMTTCRATVSAADATHTPAVNLQTFDRIVLGWYDLPAPAVVRIEVQCREAAPFQTTVHLTSGGIATVRDSLRR